MTAGDNYFNVVEERLEQHEIIEIENCIVANHSKFVLQETPTIFLKEAILAAASLNKLIINFQENRIDYLAGELEKAIEFIEHSHQKN